MPEKRKSAGIARRRLNDRHQARTRKADKPKGAVRLHRFLTSQTRSRKKKIERPVADERSSIQATAGKLRGHRNHRSKFNGFLSIQASPQRPFLVNSTEKIKRKCIFLKKSTCITSHPGHRFFSVLLNSPA